jgi:hypothetical protein
MSWTALTGQSKVGAATLFARWIACIRLGALVQGTLAFVQGELFGVFRALVWWFALFA